MAKADTIPVRVITGIPKWEYFRVAKEAKEDRSANPGQLAYHGLQGWELCTETDRYYTFKRMLVLGE